MADEGSSPSERMRYVKMIVVKIELHPSGNADKAIVLDEFKIINNLTSPDRPAHGNHGNYDISYRDRIHRNVITGHEREQISLYLVEKAISYLTNVTKVK